MKKLKQTAPIHITLHLWININMYLLQQKHRNKNITEKERIEIKLEEE